jgi:hypothetical protein
MHVTCNFILPFIKPGISQLLILLSFKKKQRYEKIINAFNAWLLFSCQ